MSLLTCRHLSVSYDGKAVLSDLNFSVDEGDYLGIVGENGAGKSTLVKALLRLKKISGGEIVTADGFKPTEIGYLPQQTPVQKDFPASVWEVVLSGRLNRCGMYPFYRKSDKEDAEEKMEMLGIADLKKRCYRDLSGDCSSIGFNRYYETMAFYAEFEGEYIEADVSREIPFNSKWFISQDEYVANKGSIDNKANDMHENVVKELYTSLVTYGLIDMKHINP